MITFSKTWSAYCAYLALFLVCASALASTQRSPSEQITPLLLAVHDAPIPFIGSDGNVHLVYELWMTNFSSGDVDVERIDISSEGQSLAVFDESEIAKRLQPCWLRESRGSLEKSTSGLLFVHLVLPRNVALPRRLTHRVLIRAKAAPAERQKITENGGEVQVENRPVVIVGPPLAGEGYVSADSCCDASRHTRAALPVNGRVWIAQRYAVDWEQIDGSGRIYSGPRENLSSYKIYGQQVLAVADAVVASVTDGLANQIPGHFPAAIPIEQADGNSIVLDLGGGRFAVYAHLQAGSLKVHKGETVRKGQVMALVGNSGNSLAPHLHFHVMDGASALVANGLPYEIDAFRITGRSAGTAEFDKAEADGTPLALTPVFPAERIANALPLDQLIISFVH